MIRVVNAMLAVVIEDLEIHLYNSNLLTGKSAICFKTLAQKKRLIYKHLIHYITNTKSLFYRSICSSWENLGRNSTSTSILNCFNP